MVTKTVFVKVYVVRDVCDQHDYISNPERQKGTKKIKEKLLGFYQTPNDSNFWINLAETNQQINFKYSRSGVVIEARELILQISNEIYKIASPEDHLIIAKMIAEEFKEKYGVEVAVGIHINDNCTNYHAHILFSERIAINAPSDRKPVTKNTYFDQFGRRSTKSVCVDSTGSLKSGCLLFKKGEFLPVRAFGSKIKIFSSPSWIFFEKERQARFMTELCHKYGVKEKWERYDNKTNPHIHLYNIKNNYSTALKVWMKIENRKIKAYNDTIDELLASDEITIEQALAVKEIILAQRRINKEKRDRARERFLNNYSDRSKQRQEAFEEYEINNWIRYRKDGTQRSIIELLVILGMILCGVDLREFACEDLGISEEDLIVTPANENVTYIKFCPNLQNLADELAIAAGRKSPTEMLAEHQAKEAAARISNNSMQQNSSLSDLIAAAEYNRHTKALNQDSLNEKEAYPEL